MPSHQSLFTVRTLDSLPNKHSTFRQEIIKLKLYLNVKRISCFFACLAENAKFLITKRYLTTSRWMELEGKIRKYFNTQLLTKTYGWKPGISLCTFSKYLPKMIEVFGLNTKVFENNVLKRFIPSTAKIWLSIYSLFVEKYYWVLVDFLLLEIELKLNKTQWLSFWRFLVTLLCQNYSIDLCVLFYKHAGSTYHKPPTVGQEKEQKTSCLTK